ncbi:hypothetical protein MAR_009322 [Mya arenaria]|uniref:Uncharacterized protein n=1 Tax=Mya arenaria TaxID=6604 RepID=A0ABY7E2V4_MYAAR|nr:hypothetical protein MAR_009322 [Mya arenaria]
MANEENYEELEKMYGDMFSYRYTDKDKDYVETVSSPVPSCPCVTETEAGEIGTHEAKGIDMAIETRTSMEVTRVIIAGMMVTMETKVTIEIMEVKIVTMKVKVETEATDIMKAGDTIHTKCNEYVFAFCVIKTSPLKVGMITTLAVTVYLQQTYSEVGTVVLVAAAAAETVVAVAVGKVYEDYVADIAD